MCVLAATEFCTNMQSLVSMLSSILMLVLNCWRDCLSMPILLVKVNNGRLRLVMGITGIKQFEELHTCAYCRNTSPKMSEKIFSCLNCNTTQKVTLAPVSTAILYIDSNGTTRLLRAYSDALVTICRGDISLLEAPPFTVTCKSFGVIQSVSRAQLQDMQ